MMPRRILTVAVLLIPVTLALDSCGHVADLQPSRGHALPVKPFMARKTPTSAELLTIPTYAKPDRVDELMSRSEPRPQDPFDLPPATGGSAPALPPASGGSGPSLPPGSETQPQMNQTAPNTPGPNTPGD